MSQYHFNKQNRENIIQEFIVLVKDFPLKMVQNLKQLPANFIEKLLKTITRILNQNLHMNFSYQESERFMNLLELEFHFAYVQSQNLQQKVQGITNIIQKINKLIDEENSINYRGVSIFHYQQPPDQVNNQLYFPQWTENDEISVRKSVLQWLKSKQIFERIFNEASHHEIIKRSFPIVKFLYQSQDLSHDQILFIYRLAAGKHHSLRSCVFQLLNNLVNQLEIADLNFVFNEVQRVAFADVDLDYINLIKAIILNSRLSSVKHIPLNQQNQEGDGINPAIQVQQYNFDENFQKDTQNTQYKDANPQNNQNNVTDEEIRSNEASLGDENQCENDQLNNDDEIKKSIENHIQKNQFAFEGCDNKKEKKMRKSDSNDSINSAKKRNKQSGKGRQYRRRNNDETTQFSHGNGRYVTIVSPEAIRMYEYLWSIIKYGCTQYNSLSQEVIDKAIEIMKTVVENYYRPLKFVIIQQ